MSGCERQSRNLGPREWLDRNKKVFDRIKEQVHRGVLVVARDLIMHLLPQSLDHIGFGRLGR